MGHQPDIAGFLQTRFSGHFESWVVRELIRNPIRPMPHGSWGFFNGLSVQSPPPSAKMKFKERPTSEPAEILTRPADAGQAGSPPLVLRVEDAVNGEGLCRNIEIEIEKRYYRLFSP